MADGELVVDREQLKLTFLNLLLNAAQAMGGGGTIRIESVGREGWHEFRVIDEGPGIPEHIKDQLFEPFFTTKSRGTGLGLAMARRIVDRHGGTIGLVSPEGGGTTVTIRLPLLHQGIPGSAAPSAAPG